MASVDAVIGNSSSGILEAPSFKIGTINIGNRQSGRTQATSIINVDANKNQIMSALEKLTSKKFRSILKTVQNPYGEGGASSKIVKVLEECLLGDIIQKKFRDINLDNNCGSPR